MMENPEARWRAGASVCLLGAQRVEVLQTQKRKRNLRRLQETSGPSSEEPDGSVPSTYATERSEGCRGFPHSPERAQPNKATLAEPWQRLLSVPELGFDVNGAGGAVLHLLLLLLPQDALGQQVVGGCDVVVLVGLQGSESTVT